MIIKVFENKVSLSRAAAEEAATALRRAIKDRGRARIIAATGMAQVDFLQNLTSADGIGWHRVEMFHLDEYVGLPSSHPASFRKFLREHLIDKTGITRFHFLDGDRDLDKVLADTAAALGAAPVDVAFVGIGENGHLAFNDPPADFETEEPFLIVNLDEACRYQQVGEGWFKDLSEVPRQAISMSVRQVLKANQIIAVVPDARKAPAVKLCLEGDIRPMAPASILRNHPATTAYLDKHSSALLNPATISADTAAGSR
ncbi:MAG TPA: 6-phosphogluconolactonase [Vicinamibacterales bacterium]|nr:6-phosphogluconolactonase [Vicinamibacterales bacterium]